MMNAAHRITLTVGALALLAGCAGYRLGNVPYREMEGVKKIYVPVVKNKSYEPAIQVMVTNAILRRMDRDGTYTSGREKEADATLEVTVTELKRDPARSARNAQLVTEEYEIKLYATATLINHRTGQRLFKDRVFFGETNYFIPENRQQEVERQSMPLAAEDLADKIVRSITEGW
jgi:hypothetical protein